TLELAECFNAGDRGVSRMGWSNEYYDEKIWEIAGAAPWETFDRRLEADAAKDALAAALAAKDRSEATCVARALYRLDVLAEADARERELDAATRAQLGFEALRDLDALRRLGSVSVVAFRARARRLALPAPLGARLAEIDLRRALAWGAEMERRGAHTAEDTAREYYESAFYLVL